MLEVPLSLRYAVLAGAFAVAVALPGPRLAAQASTTAPAQPSIAGLVVGACHVSPVVEDLDRSVRFYRDVLGFESSAPVGNTVPWSTDPALLRLYGVPRGRLRSVSLPIPGTKCGVEPVEFGQVDRTPVRRRLPDPGTVTLILLVRDIDAALKKVKAAGVPIVSTGGAVLDMSTTNRTRAIIVQDPDGQFIELAQLDPQPPTTATASSNVAGIRFRVTVTDVERTLRFYETGLGIAQKVPTFAAGERVMDMMGLPRSGEYRVSLGAIPGSTLVLEFLELKGVGEARVFAPRAHDPGAYRLPLRVNPIDEALSRLTRLGSPVVSSGGTPVAVNIAGDASRLAVTKDPDGLFLVLQQGPS